MYRLGQIAKIECRTGIEPAISHSIDVLSPSCATLTVESFLFALLTYALKNQISSEKLSKIYYMGDLHLQLPSSELQLEFCTGLYLDQCKL